MPSSHKAISTSALRFLRSLLHGHPPRPCPPPPTAALVATQQRSHSAGPLARRRPSPARQRRLPTPAARRRQSSFSPAAAAAHAATLLADPARALGLDPYDLFPQTLPLGAPPRGPFAVDARALRREFLALQQRAHPDVAGQQQQRSGKEVGGGAGGAGEAPAAGALAARINDAYATLSDPLRRARHILRARGALGDEEGTMSELQDGELLAEVMEAREEAERVAGDEAAEAALRRGNAARMDDVVERLAEAFARDDLEAARVLCVRLKYWQGVEEVLRHGGVMH
jgi:molecular chaperone HscB